MRYKVVLSLNINSPYTFLFWVERNETKRKFQCNFKDNKHNLKHNKHISYCCSKNMIYFYAWSLETLVTTYLYLI